MISSTQPLKIPQWPMPTTGFRQTLITTAEVFGCLNATQILAEAALLEPPILTTIIHVTRRRRFALCAGHHKHLLQALNQVEKIDRVVIRWLQETTCQAGGSQI